MSSKEKITIVTQEIQEQYLSDNTPWVIGYSGGKDSTTVVNLVLHALSSLSKDKLTKEIHILSNNTLVENPTIVKYVGTQLNLLKKAGKEKLFNHAPHLFQVAEVIPKLEDRFWLNLIGKGYPSPNRWFRWCTDRMKINPTNDYILKQVSYHGKTVIVLGTRKAESTNRANSIKKYDLDLETTKFRKHALPNAWVYAPIQDWENEEVWIYLLQVPSFWNGDNRQLITLYKNASPNASECPLVVDSSTPSCGHSRFGCWTCTVVNRDKSMENLIGNGEEWMQPLLDFRDELAKIRNDESKRELKSAIYTNQKGPFKFIVRAELLKRLLQVEKQADLELVSKSELAAIQVQWNYHGCFEYNVADIYERIKGEKLVLSEEQQSDNDAEELELLKQVAEEFSVNSDHIRELMIIEKEHVNFLRRKSIFDDIEKKIKNFTMD
jgi:DNA sulfur modification protein DndC